MEYRVQAACMIVVLYVAFSYLSHKRVQTDFKKIYMAMIATAVVLISFDAVVVYLAVHHDSISIPVSDFFHRVYFICMDLMVYITFRYVTHLVGNRKQFGMRERIMLNIPFILSVTFAVVMPIHYRQTNTAVVAFGAAAVALDLNVIAYVLLSVVIIYKYGSDNVRPKLNALMRAFSLLVITAVFEMFYPYADIYPICVMMLILMVYLALGDPREYEDNVSGGFNRAAFIEVLDERFNKKEPFAVLNVVITNWTEIMDITDGAVDNEMFSFARSAAAMLSVPMYRSAYNSVSFIIPIEKCSEFKTDEVEKMTEKSININGNDICMKAVKSLLLCPSNVQGTEQVLENINSLSVNAYRDRMFIDNVTGCLNRNAYENDMINMNARRGEFSSIACIMVDVNGLKATNDTWGHKSGDELIISTAKLLNESFGSIARIYRIGGDEFLCLFTDVSREMIDARQELLEELRGKEVLSFGMTVSFATGTAYIGEYDANVQDMVKRADRAMYRDKLKSGAGRK